jgi:hypothetical protein
MANNFTVEDKIKIIDERISYILEKYNIVQNSDFLLKVQALEQAKEALTNQG